MTTAQLIALDLAVGALVAVAWLGAGAALAARRPVVALPLFAVAVLATLGRFATVAVLGGHGWWFVQEKVTVALPLMAVTVVPAAVLAGPGLIRSARRGRADLPHRPGAAVALLTAGYAGVAGLGLTLLAGYPATWSSGLLAAALVGAGALVTWRVTTPSRADSRLAASSSVDSRPAASSRVDSRVAASSSVGSRVVASSRVGSRLVGRAATVVIALVAAAGVGLVFLPADSFDTGGGPAPVAATGHLAADHAGAGHRAAQARQGGTARSASPGHHAEQGDDAHPAQQNRQGRQAGHANKMPEAGVAGAGVPEAGVAGAGMPEAGVAEAGVAEAGVAEAGVAQAGVGKAGVDEAGVAEADMGEAGVAEAGLGVAGLGQGGADHVGEGVGVGGHGGSTPVTELTGPATPAPGGVVRRYELTARKATVTLASGRRVEAWTYNGQVPGPAITATQGDLIEVTLRNADIGIGVTLHWHGYDVPAAEDGAPGLTQAAVMPGQTFTYRFRADQAGTYWYHTHQVSHVGVRMGLYGPLVVTPRAGAAPAAGLDLTLPAHTLNGTVIIGDHDRPIAREAKPGAPVRLRLINTDSTPHRFTLDGTPYRLVAVDGRDLSGPGELTRSALLLPAGGRFDLAFAMPEGPVTLLMDGARTGGLRLLPATAAAAGATAAAAGATGATGATGTTGMTGAAGRDDGDTPGVEAAVEAAAGRVPVRDTSAWPELDLNGYGTPAPLPITLGSRFDRRFTLVLDRGLAMVKGAPRYAQTVNGLGFPNIPSEVVRENDLVLLTIVNRGLEIHPWHLHGHPVLVLSRDGVAPTGSPMWRDTFDVLPGQVWQVAFRATNPGLWMNHCHNLPHVAQGMALHLLYEGVTTPFHGGHGG